MKYKRIDNILTLAIMLAMLTGCAMGPDFVRPAPPAVAVYTVTPSVLPESRQTQQVEQVSEIGSQWWQQLGSARLNSLIDDALRSSPTLAAAEAKLRQSQELYGARAGSTLYPQLNANLGSQRQRFSPSSSGLTGDSRDFSLYNASLGVRYNFDMAGSNRRALEALAAQSDYQFYQLEGARLTVVGSIVATAITQAKLAQQVHLSQTILGDQEQQLDLTRSRVRLGQAAADEELSLQTQVEQTRAAIYLLSKQHQQSANLLAVLAGFAPGAEGLPAFRLQDFTLPAALPLLVPSALVHARPDILAAEAVMCAANAEYGVAVANLYPKLNLSADLGSQALTTGAMFGSGATVWSLVGQLTQPLFNPGLPAEKRAALAGFEAAAAQYQTVVLEALRNVADVLQALESDGARLTALTTADAAAKGYLESVQEKYRLGAGSYVEVLIAQQQAQQTQIDLIAAQSQHLIDSAALFQAMGGGTAPSRITLNLER
jgi:NodT family efflux transporter outer membrane factor (OMF) lipoprotein